MYPVTAGVQYLTAFSAGFKAYEMEDDVVKDLSEFALANALYAALVEGHAAETNARYVTIVKSISTVIEFGCIGETPWTTPPRTPPT